MIELKDNEIKLLQHLLNQFDYKTSIELAEFCNVSNRSIKTYISRINDYYPNLIISSMDGYKISNREKAADLINQQIHHYIPQSPKDRESFILKRLLISNQSTPLETFADELFVSTDTILNDVTNIRKLLLDFDLTLSINADILKINGPDYNKKKLLKHKLIEDSKDSFLSLTTIQEYFPNIDLFQIKEIFLKILNKHQYFIDDFSLLNFILHLAVTMERQQINKESLDINTDGYNFKKIEAIIDELSQEIDAKFHYHFSFDDKQYFQLLIMTRIISKSVSTLSFDNLENIVGSETYHLVSLISHHLSTTFNISIKNQDFLIRFSLHIKNLLARLKNKISFTNLQLRNIKDSFPFIYDVSVYIAKLIMNETHFVMSEDEISYISLHLGALIEEQEILNQKITAVFLVPTYFFNSYDLVNRCIEHFKNEILILGIVSSENDLNEFEAFDLLISTVPLKKAYSSRIVYTQFSNPHRLMNDLQQIVLQIIKHKKVDSFKKQLNQLFHRELFFIFSDKTDKDSTINILCDALKDLHYTNDDFKQKIFEREMISPSAYSNIAMPHPLEMIANKTAVAVSLHPEPLKWNENNVRIVFMIATKNDEKLYLKEIFDMISSIIIDNSIVISLSQMNTYDEFISSLATYIEEKIQ